MQFLHQNLKFLPLYPIIQEQEGEASKVLFPAQQSKRRKKNMSKTTTQYVRKPLEDMDVIDDFLFTEIMSDAEYGLEVCRIILSSVLMREVGYISFTPQMVAPGVSENKHGIRLDAYITEKRSKPGTGEDEIRIYDVEPDKHSDKKAGLPRRSRYYADLIDSQLLKTSVDYDELPELITIFILSYDPFGENAMFYEAGTTLKTHPHISYNDGVRRIFLYVDGKLPEDAGENEKSLMKLLHYIGRSTKDNVTDDATKKLDDIVCRTKSKKDVGVRYLKSWEREKELREEGREEGQLEHLIALVCKKLAKGKDISTIKEELEEDDDSLIVAIVRSAQDFAPDYDPEAVYEAYISQG